MSTTTRLLDAIESGEIDTLLFDLDGVLTPTSDLHRRAWKALFDPVLVGHGVDPYVDADYFAHLDGKQRMDGVREVLESRGIELLEGGSGQDPGKMTVWSLAESKNDAFNQLLAREGIAPYPGTSAFLEYLQRFPGVKMGVVSSSRNAGTILEMSRLDKYFSTVVDGLVAAREGLSGKPSPDTFVRAAQNLNSFPSKAVVFEDALSGVAAGARGGFAYVVGIDRGAGRQSLLEGGATLVVDDLVELVPVEARSEAEIPVEGSRLKAHGRG